MRSRLLVSVIGVPVILVVILWAPVMVLVVALALLSAIAAFELMRCVGVVDSPRKSCVLSNAAILGALCAVFVQYRYDEYYAALIVIYTLLIFAYAVYRAGEIKFQQIMAALFAMYAIPYAFSSFLRLHEMGVHRAYLLLPLLFSFCSDTGAFFAGRAFGCHKLAPKVSPHKTVEGAVGGLLGNAVGAVIFALIMNLGLGEGLDYPGIVALGVICSVIAQLGDLSFSLIKREFGIKDYGHIFLEHGGVLDRFDSVIFVAPVLAAFLPALM